MTALEVITGAIDRVNKGWTQKEFARDAHGNPCTSFSKDAACFCVLGALAVTREVEQSAVYPTCMSLLRKELFGGLDLSISNWNDAKVRTKEDVLTVLTNVKTKLEKQDGG